MKVHPADAGLVIGNRGLEAGAVSVSVQGKENLGAKPRVDIIAGFLKQIRERES